MITTTSAGFVSFFAFIPLILKNHINFFWRWVTSPSTPPHSISSLCLLSLSTCEHERFNGNGDRLRLGAVRGETDRETERVRESEEGGGGVETDWFPPPAAASQQTSEARQDPACPQPGQAACLRAGLPPGAPGPGTVRRHQENNYADRGVRCARSETHMLKHTSPKINSLMNRTRTGYDRFSSIKMN